LLKAADCAGGFVLLNPADCAGGLVLFKPAVGGFIGASEAPLRKVRDEKGLSGMVFLAIYTGTPALCSTCANEDKRAG
jgi:hypothetical protein